MHRNIGFPLDDELERRIEAFAQATSSTPHEVVRRAFEEYELAHSPQHESVTMDESALDALRRAGVVGCVKGGIPDLSSNPKYM